MKLYDQGFAERLQAEVERIPLPPRERWIPRPRSSFRFVPLAAAVAALALAVLVAGPVIDELRSRGAGVGSSGAAPDAVPSASCGPRARVVAADACLVAGTLVEIVGSDGGLMASTNLVRVRLDDPALARRYGEPALFETDSDTQIEPSAPTIAATGVKPGAPVRLAFDQSGARKAAGAYVLTRFVVVSSGELPDCLVVLEQSRFPQGDSAKNGGATPEDALRRENPAITRFTLFPMGKDPKAPVWIVAGSDTFVATILTDGTWFVSPARFVRCRDPREIRWLPGPTGPSQAAAPSAPAATGPVTADEVAAGMPAGTAFLAGTDPTCALEGDGSYRCVLASPPAPELSSFLGAKEVLAIRGVAGGGCVGLDAGGMTWRCYLGQDAVDAGIIGQGFLGQPILAPGRG